MRVILFFLALLGLLSLLSIIKLPQNTLWQDFMIWGVLFLLLNPDDQKFWYKLRPFYIVYVCLVYETRCGVKSSHTHSQSMCDCKIQDVLVFVYLDIHLTVCQNSKYTNVMQSTFAWIVCC